MAVLEARDRVGGRAYNHHIGGGEISEAGATFVGPTQGHILRLAKRFAVGKFPTYDTGDNVYYKDGTRLTYSDKTPAGIVPPDPTIAADAAAVVTLMDQLSTEVPVDAPWQASRAGQWDGQTLESWAQTHSSYSKNKSFRRLVAVATRPIFGAEPREISFLFTLFYIAASGDERHPGTFERNFSTRNGAQMWRFVGGTELLAQKMARQPRRPSRAALTGDPHRPGRRARHRALGAPGRAGEARDRRRSPRLSRAASTTTRRCRRLATSSPSACPRGR